MTDNSESLSSTLPLSSLSSPPPTLEVASPLSIDSTDSTLLEKVKDPDPKLEKEVSNEEPLLDSTDSKLAKDNSHSSQKSTPTDPDQVMGHPITMDSTKEPLNSNAHQTSIADNLSVHGSAPLYEVLTEKEQKTILYSVYLARFLAVLDATIVSVSLPSILAEVGGEQYLSWLVASYLLSDSVVLPLSGRLSDLYGRRPLYLGSLVVFLVGSALCGAATNIWFLIGSRFLQGIGGGGLTGMTMIIPGDVVTPKDRPAIFATLGIIAGLGALLGPIIGGGLTDAYSWRLVFYVNLPFGAVAFFLGWFSMKKFEIPKKKLQVDSIGSLLVAISTISLILFVTWGGEKTIGYPWNSPQIIALIIIFCVTFILFIVQEYHHPLPTLQLRLHKIRNVWINLLVVFFSYYSMVSVVNYLAVYFQNVLGDIPIISGLKLGGFVGGFILTSRYSGKILMKTSKSNYVMGAAGGLLAIGLGLMSMISPTLNYGWVFLFTLIMGLGIGFLIPATGAMLQLSVPQRDIAVAMANYSFDCYIGGCIGVTVSGTIFTRTLANYLSKGYTYKDAVSKGIGATFLWSVPPVVFVSLFAFFLEPVKKKKPKVPEKQEEVAIELTAGNIQPAPTQSTLDNRAEEHHVDVRESLETK